MPDTSLQIQRMHLRAPGDSVEVGQQLGRELSRGLSDIISTRAGPDVNLGALSLRVSVPERATGPQVRAAVLAAIAAALE